MNPLNDHELLLWAMRAGLTHDEVRQAVRGGLDANRIPRQRANETQAQRQDRLQAVRDYLQDQYLAGYSDYLENMRGMNAQRAAGAREAGTPFQAEEPMTPWQWRNLPSHARARWTGALHEELATKNEYGRLAMGPEWVKRQGASHLFGIEAVTRSSFLGIEGGQTLSTWEPSKVMKRIQMLGAHEQVGFTEAPTIRLYIKPGPDSPMPNEFTRMRTADDEGGAPGPSGQGYSVCRSAISPGDTDMELGEAVSQLAGKTPEEAYVLIENALTGATTIAEMRQVLTQLLPVIGAGLVYLARSLEE